MDVAQFPESSQEVLSEEVIRTFQAYNRGILVSTVYATIFFLVYTYLPLVSPGLGRDLQSEEFGFLVFGFVGFVIGAIVSFSNSFDLEEQKQDLKNNLLDALMVCLWTANACFLINLLGSFIKNAWWPSQLVTFLGAFGIASLFGALIGQPLLLLLGGGGAKSFRPFLYVNALTDSMENRDAQFALRVFLQTIVTVCLVSIAIVAIAVFITLLMMWLMLVMISFFLSEGSSRPNLSGWFSSNSERREVSRAVESRMIEEERRREEELARQHEKKLKQQEKEKRKKAETARKQQEKEKQKASAKTKGKHYNTSGEKLGRSYQDGDKTEHYDSSGNKTGRSYRQGEKSDHYDTSGNKTGRSYDHGDYVDHYDTSGNKTGRSYDHGDYVDHYDTSGNKTGKTYKS